MNLLFECTIDGRPIIKKNTQRVVRKPKQKPRVIYSPKFAAWQRFASLQVRRAMQIYPALPITSPCRAEFIFYFKDHQAEADTSNLCEAPADLLQKMGVIKDDKLFYEIHARKVFGMGEPRTEIKIYGGE